MKKLFLLSLLFVAGCAYFNTFYNAKTYFESAEKKYWEGGKLTPQLRKSYEKTIEKCARILQYYPRSKYVDDALFLMGVSYSRLGEKEKARRKFEELFSYYPESPYVEKARLEYGRVLIDLGEWAQADEVLRKVKGKYKDEALLLLGKSLYFAGDYRGALDKLRHFEEVKKSPFKKEAIYYVALSYNELGIYDSAELYLRKYLDEFFLTSDESYNARKLLGEILMKRGAYEKAIDVFNSMNLAPTSRESRVISLKIAMCYAGMGDSARAIETLEKVIERAASSEEALEARFRLGQLYESMDSLQMALKYYDEASKMYIKSYFKEEALRRAKALRSLAELEETKSDEERYKLAEIYLFELNKLDEALDIFQSILKDSPDTPLKPKIYYSLVYIYKEKGEEDKAREYLNKLLSEYPLSFYSQKAREFFGKSLN